MFFYIVVILFVLILMISTMIPKRRKSLLNKHVVITGGSSGIGKAIAILAAKKGAHVTVIARDPQKLQSAYSEIKQNVMDDDQIIKTVSCDVSIFEQVERNFNDLEDVVGPIYMLINCAGMAICHKVEEYTIEEIQKLIDVNFLGTLYPIKTIVPKMKERKEGIIVLTSSQAGLVGLFGYSVYGSVKFALRGLAESIRMELKPYNVSITLSLPPDTDTPGFENENKTKPIETKEISGTAGLFKPEDIASKVLNDALAGRFFSVIGFESSILTTLCVGMTPFYSAVEIIEQVFLLGVLRLVSLIYLTYFDHIVKRCHIVNENKLKTTVETKKYN